MTFIPTFSKQRMRYDLWQMAAWVLIAIVVLGIFGLVLSGCRQLPVLKGEYQDARVEQAKVDAKQSDRIADVVALEDGMGQVVEAIAPEEQKPAAKAVRSKIAGVKAQADAQAAQHRERAAQEERKLEELNAQPGAVAWISSVLGGNWSGLLDLILGALGAGGLAHGMRMKSRADRMASKAVMYAEEEPAVARKLAAQDPDLAKHRRKS